MKSTLNKSVIANTIAVATVAAGFLSPWANNYLLNIGLFALSGGLTNWLAIHMLFEKVPLLYGSGVIPQRFEQFKTTIRELMMEQFFTSTQLQRFIEDEERLVITWFKPQKLLETLDYDKLYQRLKNAILETSLGGVIKTFGGERMLESMKQPLINKLRETLAETMQRDTFKNALLQCIDQQALLDDVRIRIESVVDKRLEELTPQLVKSIVSKIIREHLGWLVVWGVVFGGFLGLLVSLITPYLAN